MKRRKFLKTLSIAFLLILVISLTVHIIRSREKLLVTVYIHYECERQLTRFRFWVNQIIYDEKLALKFYGKTAIEPRNVYTNPFSFRLSKGNYTIGIYSLEASFTGMKSFELKGRDLRFTVTLQSYLI